MSGENDSSLEKFWESVNVKSKSMELSLDSKFRRFNGCYFTDFDLASDMAYNLIESMDENQKANIQNLKFLEPCVGTGNFVFAYLRKAIELTKDVNLLRTMLDNIYVSDVSEQLLKYYQTNLQEFSKTFLDLDLSETYFEKHTHLGLLYNINSDIPNYIDINDAFPGVGRFDIIITNPPYKNLKAEKDQFSSCEDYENTKETYAQLRNVLSKKLTYSVKGTLNIYKLFVEEIIEKYAAQGALISLLIPNSILTDKSCEELRKRIIGTCGLIRIEIIREDSSYVDAQQALCTFFIRKGMEYPTFSMNKDYCNNKTAITKIDLSDIKKIDGFPIVAVDESEYDFLKQLRKFPVLSSYPFIHNLRGELDLTFYKEYISSDSSQLRLIRGKHISRYFLKNDSEYAISSFVDLTKKSKYIRFPRIACQQISNMLSEERVIFAYVPKNYVLANSCNFIVVDDNKYGMDIYYLLGLLNSSVINWYFKLTSSNNHINNYEIDSFPVPNNPEYTKIISTTVQKYLETKNTDLLVDINNLVKENFNIAPKNKQCQTTLDALSIRESEQINQVLPFVSKKTCEDIVTKNTNVIAIISTQPNTMSEVEKAAAVQMREKFFKISQNKILNHYELKLSELDLEMIRSVPQGGNWKDIPEETVHKSQRLMQIAANGGRTTLYGRIDYTQPSYTISTYLNRPGNGTFVHPIHDRVLTFREAARFQSFKDDYYFTGRQSKVMLQIGNAVPPLLAMQIARRIKEKTGCLKTLGLFCGAGGFTVGFKEAGMQSVLETDYDFDACVTCKTNNPEIPVLCADITEEKTKEMIVQTAIEKGVEIICGGPPCQGFSMAGKRFIDDPRNQLFKHYAEVVSKVKPKIFIFENVTGLLSMSKGEVYAEIFRLFSSFGYIIDGRILNAADYGVPQKRKRVIVIGARSDIGISPTDLYPNPTTFEDSKKISAYDTISDLEDVPCIKDSEYDQNKKLSLYEMEMRSLAPYGKHIWNSAD